VEGILQTKASSRQSVGSYGQGQRQVGIAVVVNGKPSNKLRRVGTEDLDGDVTDTTTAEPPDDSSPRRFLLRLALLFAVSNSERYERFSIGVCDAIHCRRLPPAACRRLLPVAE
jgi:hypothetical protein